MQVNSRGEITHPSYPLPKNYSRLLNKWSKEHPWVSLGDEIEFPLESKILGTPTIIKDRVRINGPFTIKGSAELIIGKYCDIAENLFITTSNHRTDQADLQGKFTVTSDISKGSIYIGNNVWCGDNVTVLSGVTVGDGAVIGAGSVVTRDVPPFAVAVGAPARVVKYRFSRRVILKLLDLSWWHWNKKTIAKNINFFKEVINDKNIDDLINKINYSSEEEVVLLKLKNKTSSKWLLDGWEKNENKGQWVEKKEASLILKTLHPEKYNFLSFFAHSYYLPQRVKIYVNRKYIANIKIFNKWFEYKIQIKQLKKGVNTIRITFEKGFSPLSLKQNDDRRILYCSFKRFLLL